MSAKFVKFFGLIGLVVAVILAVAFKEKILLIAGVYWASLILLTIILRIVKPEEFKTLKYESDEEEKASAIENTDFESEGEKSLLRGSFLDGKYSFRILMLCFIAVLIGGFILIIFTGVEYDENQAYIANEGVFNRTFGDFIFFQLAPISIAAVLTSIGCVHIYELFSGVVTKEEIKEHKISLWKYISLAIIPIAIVFVFVFSVQNWATILTEEGVEVHRPYAATVYHQWEDMTSFTYDEGGVISSSEADIKFKSGAEVHIDLYDFQKWSDMFYETYGHNYIDGKRVSAEVVFFEHIFLEKYAHLNSND